MALGRGVSGILRSSGGAKSLARKTGDWNPGAKPGDKDRLGRARLAAGGAGGA
eukprot:CAMPEP_0206829556 /NCGR_PEP_ID=MMETSP0975-20121206/16425_1 /ASSEMBLY_ACC=CAM_ASM_000399 /TAXON_ID=483370 /ORGANISM="non described non described, Strain CCMP2097" /LENGTH=52 /DNA_ID=CAMNT_0054371895 /DNA_START=135 /DNA_END=290 /DNA_ORIENTATION=-